MIVLFRVGFALCLCLAACGDKEREAQKASYDAWQRQLQVQDVFSPEQLSGIWVLDRLTTLYSDPYDHRHDSALQKDYQDNSVLLLFFESQYVRATIPNKCTDSAQAGDWLVNLAAEEVRVNPEEPTPLKWALKADLTAEGLYKAATSTRAEKFTAFELERDLLKTPLLFRENRKRESYEETHVFKLHEVDGKRTLELTHLNTSLTTGIHALVERYHALSDTELRARFEQRIKENYPCPK